MIFYCTSIMVNVKKRIREKIKTLFSFRICLITDNTSDKTLKNLIVKNPILSYNIEKIILKS